MEHPDPHYRLGLTSNIWYIMDLEEINHDITINIYRPSTLSRDPANSCASVWPFFWILIRLYTPDIRLT